VATHKKRLEICDDDGMHLMSVHVEPDANGFEGADLSGLGAPLIRGLRGASFRKATLYWACLAEADLSGCNFEEADLRGATLTGALLVGANLRSAQLCRDNLGGSTQLQGADLSGADLVGANLEGAEYDSQTKFPSGFQPKREGCILKDAS
jgi:uncharacterized protein YjbI with pentapeptide repeats